MMDEPTGFRYVANLALGLVLLALGALATRIPRRGPTRWLLAAYLALVGLNYATEGLSRLLKGDVLPLPFNGVDATAILDPPTLLLFALSLAGIRLTLQRAVAPYLPAAYLILQPILGLPGPAPILQALDAWPTLAFYLAAYLVLARAHFADPDPAERKGKAVLLTAFGVVCLSRVPLLLLDVSLVSGVARAAPESLVLDAMLLATYAAFALLARAWARGAAWPEARGVVAATGVLLLVLDLEWLLRFVDPLTQTALALMFSTRWFLFLAVVTAGLRRHEVLGIPTLVAPWLQGVFRALLAVVAAVMASTLASAAGAPTTTALLTGVGLVALGVASAYALRAAAPSPPSEAEWRRTAVYRAHLAFGSPPEELERVRRQLGLPEREARAIADAFLLEEQVAGRVRPERVEAGRTLLGRYRVERVVGVGAFGRVYAAMDEIAGERVVLKELLPEWQAHPEAVDRFRREAETALRIRHPNLVELRGVERLASGHVLVLGFVEGETLAVRLARGALGEAEAARLAKDLLSGLAELHRHGILHRDVKPENVVLRPGGGAVLLDFGAVTAASGGTRHAGGPHPGTQGYASPEQARGDPLGPASDVYSVGVVLWRALSGRAPPGGRVPASWSGPLAKALEARPEARHADAAAFLAALP